VHAMTLKYRLNFDLTNVARQEQLCAKQAIYELCTFFAIQRSQSVGQPFNLLDLFRGAG